MSKVQVIYEWVVELMDEQGDIETSNYFTRLEDALTFVASWGGSARVALMREEVCEDDGDVLDRQYAYIVDGTLPSTFDYGAKVPKSAQEEFAVCKYFRKNVHLPT